MRFVHREKTRPNNHKTTNGVPFKIEDKTNIFETEPFLRYEIDDDLIDMLKNKTIFWKKHSRQLNLTWHERSLKLQLKRTSIFCRTPTAAPQKIPLWKKIILSTYLTFRRFHFLVSLSNHGSPSQISLLFPVIPDDLCKILQFVIQETWGAKVTEWCDDAIFSIFEKIFD